MSDFARSVHVDPAGRGALVAWLLDMLSAPFSIPSSLFKFILPGGATFTLTVEATTRLMSQLQVVIVIVKCIM